MKREQIKDFSEIVLPFFKNYLMKVNYENRGKSDAEEFEKDFKEIIELADKALEQEPLDYKTKYENYLKKSEVVISQLRANRNRLLGALDEIRAEIEKLQTYKMFEGEKTVYIERNDVLAVIDKHKSEE